MFRETLEFARNAGERSNLAEALLNYVRWLLIFNRVKEAQEYTEEAERVLSQVGANLASIFQLFAQIALMENDYPGAREFYLEAQASFGLIGEKNQRSSVIEDLGHLEIDDGHVEQAHIYLTEALVIAREMEKKASIASRLVKLTITAYLQGKLDEAKQYFRECISLARELRSFRKINILILTVNYIPFPQEKVIVPILGAIDQSQRENQRPINPLRKRYYDRVMTGALNRLGEVRFQSAFVKGQRMSLDQALDLAWKTIDGLKLD
jgi:tetratricopeptide (TPR) repeat protein